jgi:hypothetical protein
MPTKGLQTGNFRIHNYFYGLGEIRIDSDLFLRSHSPDFFFKVLCTAGRNRMFHTG